MARTLDRDKVASVIGREVARQTRLAMEARNQGMLEMGYRHDMVVHVLREVWAEIKRAEEGEEGQ
jgi:hypothetical protein